VLRRDDLPCQFHHAIKAATFAIDGGVLIITFKNGQRYTYNNVPVRVVIEFVSAPSQGRGHSLGIRISIKFVPTS
jgi:hypothetical protein